MSDPNEALLRLATAEAVAAQAEAVEPLHLLIAVCRSEVPQLNQAFEVHGVEPVRFRRRVRGFARQVATTSDGGPHRISGRVRRILELARKEAGALARPYDPVCVFVALLRSRDADTEKVMEIERIPSAEILEYLQRMLTRIGEPEKGDGLGAAAPGATSTPMLDVYGKDYTTMARAGAFDPVIGRAEQLKQLVRVLLRKQKNCPVLVGDAGVGKTRIVEGLAMRAVAEDAPEAVSNMRIVEVQVGTLGGPEERLDRIVAEAEAHPDVVLYLDAAGMLHPALARGRVRCIGSMTLAEYRRHADQDPAIERRFQPILVEEPSPAEAREMLAGLRETYEAYHGVTITDGAIDAAVDLSVRHVPDRRLPDKACDLIDQAAAAKRFNTFSPRKAAGASDPSVTRQDVARVVEEWTGIPLDRLARDEQEWLLRMEDALRDRVVGQEVAVATVARVVRTGLAGMARPDRPRGVFLFLGPSGVGKTELAKALAEFLFDDARRMVQLDAATMAEEHSVAKLVEAVRRTPYTVVLVDEIERARPAGTDLLVELFVSGRISDSLGRTADFRNAIVILTSSFGSGEPCPSARRGAGPLPAHPLEYDPVESPDELRRELLEHFRPELLNGVNRIVPFRPLDLADVRAVIDRIVERVREERLRGKGVELRLTPPAYDVLVELGFRPACGVREMESAVERQIVEPLAQGVLDGRFKAGDTVEVAAEDDKLVLTTGGLGRGV